MKLSDIVIAKDQWTPAGKDVYFRVWDGYIWRKTVHEAYIGGYIIHKVGLETKLAKEWIGIRIMYEEIGQ